MFTFALSSVRGIIVAMQEIKTQSGEASDYISLSTIRNAFFDFFALLFKGVEYIVSSISKNLFLFFACCILGLILGYSFYLWRPVYYVSEMIVTYNDLSRKGYYEIINNLNTQFITQDYDDLEKELKLNKGTIGKIIGLEAVTINGETLENDSSSKVGRPFKIRVKTKESIETDQLQHSILDYLNNSPYLKRTKEGQKKIFEDKLAFIEKEQQKLDSLKTLYNQVLASSKMSATFYNNAMNPADFYVQSNNLANQKEGILRWLNNESEAVVVIDGLKKPVRVELLSLKSILIVGLVCGVALGVLTCLLAAITKEVQNYRRAGA